MKFYVYRWQEGDEGPKMQLFDLSDEEKGSMLLDALIAMKKIDPTLSFRRSCGEGVCGSDGMNINGKNGLACITPLSSLGDPVVLRPLPGMPVIRDLVVDLSRFYKQYEQVKPYLQPERKEVAGERLQSPAERARLDGLYECILCACCSSSCPSYWWNPDKFLGPAALLQAARFIQDTRDAATAERLNQLNDAYSLFRCHSIMNCANVCPKGLNPSDAIATVRTQILKSF